MIGSDKIKPLRSLLRGAFFCLAICSMVGFFASSYWLFDLFNHFRLHAVAASLVLATASLFIDRRIALFSLLLFLVNAGLGAARLNEISGTSAVAPSAHGGAMRILAANVYTRNDQYHRLLDIVRQQDPDIIVLTETDERWLANLFTLETRYPHRLKHPRSDNFGMAIYAKKPFTPQLMDIGDYKLPLVVADFDGFRLLAAHPIPPMSEQSMQENRVYLQQLARLAAEYKGPVILAGDLNSTVWSDSIRPLFGAGLKRLSGPSFAYTWPTQVPFLALQIDHFLASGIAAGTFDVLGDIGSDHYPIIMDAVLPR